MVCDNLELSALAEDWAHLGRLYHSAPHLSGNKIYMICTSSKLMRSRSTQHG